MKVHEIMLIDDDAATNYLSKFIIDNKGCCNNLSIFNLATEALEHLDQRIKQNQDLPDIIFLDLNMPRMNGWEFLEIFGQYDISNHPDKPLIYILSTSMNPEDKIRANTIDSVTQFYKKPISETMLDEVLYQLSSQIQ